MFGNNLTESLIIQNAAMEYNQQKFDAIVLSGDPIYEIIDKVETYLDNGYIIYDLLDNEAKDWIDFNIG